MANYNKNAGYGRGLTSFVRTQVPTFGNIMVLFNSSDSDEANYMHAQEVFTPDPDGLVRFYTSLATAEAAMESNNNDVLLLDANSTHSLTGELAISENRKHFIGMDGGGRMKGQGARVQTADGTAAISVLHVSGTRNTFRNLKIIQGDNEATSLNVLKESGESSLYQNCQFMHGLATRLGGLTTYDILMSGDSTEFHRCTIGQSTLARTAGGAGVAFDVITTAAKSTLWKDCIFQVLTTSADYEFVRVVATSDLHFDHIFINPVFMAAISDAGSCITVDSATQSVSGLNAGNVLMVNPATNATRLGQASDNDNFKIVGSDGETTLVGIGLAAT